jgi:hypothetical protein
MSKEEKNLLDKFASASQNTFQEEPTSQQNFFVKDQTSDQFQKPTQKQASLHALDLPRICFKHNQTLGKYFCPDCNHWRCEDCVNIYGSSAVCPESDSFCLTEDKAKEQIKSQIKKATSYEKEVSLALNFPLREWKMTLAIWVVVWVTASGLEAATTIVQGSLYITEILLGQGVGLSPCILSYFLLAGVANQYLINRVQGKETLQVANFSELTDWLESSMLWLCCGMFSLLPIIYYVSYSELQSALIVLVTRNPIENKSFTLKFYLITLILSAWAIVFYPLSLTAAGLQRSFLSAINPIIQIQVWKNYKVWLKTAFTIFYISHIVNFLVIFLLWSKPFGLMISSLILTITTLISFMAIGTAIEKGAEEAKKH